MSRYIVLAWPPSDEAATVAVQAFERNLDGGESWICRHRTPGFHVYAPAARPLSIRLIEGSGGVVLGDLFDRNGADAPKELVGLGSSGAAASFQRMLERHWGRYVAIAPAPGGGLDAVLRDPSGAIEAFVWRRGEIWIATSTPDASVLGGLKPRNGVDWSAIHDILCDFTATTARSALSGVEAPAPGALLSWAADGCAMSTQLWRPGQFARCRDEDYEPASALLRESVETCVGALARGAGTILTEVSGGLDSSIVAASLRRARPTDLHWLHHVTDTRGGDERAFARFLAEGLDLNVEERPKPPLVLVPEGIARSQFGARPSYNGLDAPYDADLAAIGGARGIDSIFTGMGGDGLFFLSAFPGIAIDMIRRRGVRALGSPDFAALARWTRRSGWRLGRQALIGAAFGSRRAAFRPTWVAPVFSVRSEHHPWLAEIDDLPPAKSRHVEELAHALLFQGSSLRGQVVNLVHPLLSQPILEHCLRIPVDVLTQGGRDRALAREAFRDRLPAALIDRRSKGELGPYYSRAFALGLPAFREFLLDGRLAAQGLLLRGPLEAVLTEDHLAQFGDFGALLRVVAIEAWTRRWDWMP